MSSELLVALLLIGAGATWAWRRGTQPLPNVIESPARGEAALEFLLRRGVDRSSVHFRCDSTIESGEGCVVVFEKYLHGLDDIGLQGWCSLERLPSAARDSVGSALTLHGIGYRISSIGADRLEIDIGRDTQLGISFAETVFHELCDASFGVGCVAIFHDVVYFDAPRITGYKVP